MGVFDQVGTFNLGQGYLGQTPLGRHKPRESHEQIITLGKLLLELEGDGGLQ